MLASLGKMSGVFTMTNRASLPVTLKIAKDILLRHLSFPATFMDLAPLSGATLSEPTPKDFVEPWRYTREDRSPGVVHMEATSIETGLPLRFGGRGEVMSCDHVRLHVPRTEGREGK